MNKKEPTIEEIINFDFSKDLDLELLPENEREKFNENIFQSLVERVIKKTTENLSNNDQEEILNMMKNNEDIKNIFNFIASKNENFIEEFGEEFLDFKKEIYDLIKN